MFVEEDELCYSAGFIEVSLTLEVLVSTPRPHLYRRLRHILIFVVFTLKLNYMVNSVREIQLKETKNCMIPEFFSLFGSCSGDSLSDFPY